jgi:hypothetical protein
VWPVRCLLQCLVGHFYFNVWRSSFSQCMQLCRQAMCRIPQCVDNTLSVIPFLQYPPITPLVAIRSRPVACLAGSCPRLPTKRKDGEWQDAVTVARCSLAWPYAFQICSTFMHEAMLVHLRGAKYGQPICSISPGNLGDLGPLGPKYLFSQAKPYLDARPISSRPNG